MTGALYWPTASQAISSGGSYLYDRGPSHVPRYHQGDDIRIPVGTPIYGSGDGVVTAVINTGNHSGYGRYVQVQYGTVQVRTAHMSRADVKVGQVIAVNTQLGLSGGLAGSDGAGDSTGPHCHCELHVNGALANPFAYLNPRSSIAGGGATPIPTPKVFTDMSSVKLWLYTPTNDLVYADDLNKTLQILPKGTTQRDRAVQDCGAGLDRYVEISDPAWGNAFSKYSYVTTPNVEGAVDIPTLASTIAAELIKAGVGGVSAADLTKALSTVPAQTVLAMGAALANG